MRPEVTVVMPARDAAPYLPCALTSLTEQGLDPSRTEVIVVDDASRDSTREVATRWQASLPGLRMLRHDEPQGPSASRNAALEVATGETIAFLDADDWFGKRHLRHLLDARERLEVDIVRCDVIAVRGVEREVRRAPVEERDTPLATRDHIAHGVKASMVDFPNPFSGIYARSLLEAGALAFDESLPSAEDRLWNWGILLGDHSFAVVDAPGAFYRRSVSTSLSAVYDERQLGFIDSCLTVYRRLRAGDEPEAFRIKAVHNLFALYDFHLNREDEVAPHLREERERRMIEAGLEVEGAIYAAVVRTFSAARAENLARVLQAIDAGRS